MELWERISGIVRETLALEPHARRAYLDSACEGDEALRRQVDAVLSSAEETQIVAAAPFLPGGSVIAHYRIIGELGSGGMGVVYRARDERLDREVAVKVLPPASFDNPAARARLIREAKAAAALNHPNVCAVYDVGEANGQAYIAMELVEGQTLSARLASGPLSIAALLNYARQLAAALMHAHVRGIVHRDLKCHNVIVTPDHRVKVLDFGLAKRAADVDATVAAGDIQHTLTQTGSIVGTLPYMSPEQLLGRNVTAAADMWAFGVMLYEMAGGVRPFSGTTPFELSAAILDSSPPPLPSRVPAELRMVIAACLDKAPHQRISAADASAALDGIAPGASPRPDSKAGPADPPAQAHRVRTRSIRLPGRRALVAVTVALLVAAGAIGAWRFWPQTVRTVAVLPFVNVAKDDDVEYLSEGLAETLITQMNRQASIAVSKIATVLPFKDRAGDPRAVGRELGVESVVSGSVEQVGAELKIAAQLVDVASGRQLWNGRFDRDAAELLNVQDEMARAIIRDGLRLRMTSNEQQRMVKHPTTDGDAYDLYLQARHIQRSASEDDYLYSRELLERAIIRDPNYADAYAALSGNYAMMVVDGLVRPVDAWPQVSRYMNKALALNPDLPDVHSFAHAVAFLFDWDWAEAERERKRMLQYPLRDLEAQGLRAMAVELWALGRPAEALQLARRMRELDPASPYLGTLEADYLVNAGQFEAAIPLYERSTRLDFTNPNAYFGLAEAKAGLGRFDGAIEARRKAHEIAGDLEMKDVLVSAKGEAGYRAVEQAWVRVQLEALKARQATSYTSPLDFARVYAQLGDKDQAFKYLDAAFIDRSPGLVFLKVDHAWDKVRDDPRFLAAVRNVGLP